MTALSYQDDRASLYRGEALAVLADLPDACADAIITDPPYSSGGFTRSDRTMDVHTKYVQSEQIHRGTGGGALAAFAGDNRDQRGYAYWCQLWISECLRLAKPGGVLAMFCDWRQLPVTTDAMQAGGFVWRGIVPWHKPNGRRVQGRFANNCEYVVWGTAGPRPLDTLPNAYDGFFQISAPREREHITQKPVEVMRELVKIAPRDGLVLDPFMGSGTTGVAAILEGRRFIGIEFVAHFADIAQRRIREAQLQATPRGEQPALDFDQGDQP
ncbi:MULTISPECIES: site-specific DNA-methyltransferase [unclassified Nocardia]|uniref:DNA-methyltransferase n=1 Tax=unclassified Nocardia TaxID=2637762 RepID=UPI00278BE275|nr:MULTISPECIES: site-specific DNA-methyltransferase [unclassified Nocardia]